VGFVAARTLKDARKGVIGHPKSGLLTTAHAGNPCKFNEHQGMVSWHNGARADVHTSEEPDGARGPEYSFGLADEVGTWKRVVDFQGNTTWDNLQFALRAGEHPQMVAGTTPRATAAVQYLIEAGREPNSGVTTTEGSLLDNRENLAPSFVEYILKRYSGTRLARQEIDGELLLDTEGAIVLPHMIEDQRVVDAPGLVRVVVGVDPFGGGGDACGIAAAGKGIDGHAYVLADRTCRLGPDGWGRRAVETALELSADCIVWESNFGGDMVPHVLNHAMGAMGVKIRTKKVTSSKAKHLRFEPVGAKYEREEVHHVGTFDALEDQICRFTPDGYDGDESPNNADAAVFALAELFPERPMIGWDDVTTSEAPMQ
jgi:phage terminase large subunit-like protein